MRSVRQGCQSQSIAVRHFSSTATRNDDTTVQKTGSESSNPAVDAALLGQKATGESTESWDKFAAEALSPSLGSRRRRAALATVTQVPFEQMPYQCFQEARKVLNQDREEKVSKIIEQTEKIKRIEATDASTYRGGEPYKQRRLKSLREEIEKLKILADINDPEVKRRFEDGMGTYPWILRMVLRRCDVLTRL